MHVGIIGAGIGGLATAVRLATRGHQVEVFEANEYPGGKLTTFNQGGYRFDAGPSLFTMPHFVDELFELAGKNPKDFFQYEKLPVICKYFWEDGTKMSAFADESAFANEVEEKLGVSKKRIQKSLEDSERKYQLTGEIFLHNVHISSYAFANYQAPDPLRKRKLLLNKREIKKLIGKVKEKGIALIPLKIYFKTNGKAKLLLGLARGKRMYDKRAALKEKESNRELNRLNKGNRYL